MEFASEMVIKAQMAGLRIAEVPTSLHPDGRSRAPHLRTWRDGWRHLRFMLLFSPRWLFLFPGMLLLAGGLVVSLLLIAAPRALGGAVLDINTLLVSGIVCIIGYQLIVFALFTKVFTVTEGFQPMPGYLEGLLRHFRLEHGIVVAAVMILSGAGILAAALWKWREADFGELNPRETMRWMIPGSVILALGVQTLFSSFFFSILGLRRRRRD
jgi:hypothetical protein